MSQFLSGSGIRPVDSLSLVDLPGYQPLSLGHHFAHALSPDGRTMAAITWPSGESMNGTLHLIDLDAWTDHVTDLRVDWHIYPLVFSPDGKALYWLQPGKTDSAHGATREYSLVRYALSGGQPRPCADACGSGGSSTSQMPTRTSSCSRADARALKPNLWLLPSILTTWSNMPKEMTR